MKFIKKMIREHVVLAVCIGVLAPFTTLSVISLFFSSDREIVYVLNEVFSRCGISKIPGKDCTAIYEFIIGNTGTREETVRLVWPFNLSVWDRGQQILNIAADQPRGRDPQLACETTVAQSTCLIENFAAGALLIIKLSCLACNGHEIGMMEGKPVAVQTIAKISHGDPRVTTVFRRLQDLLNLFL